MGIYLNPGNDRFQMSLNSKIYVDKSSLISYTNSVVCTAQRFVCVSRPRRFGKSVTAEMLAAYYGRDTDSNSQFCRLSIAKDSSYQKHLNQYNVFFLNMQQFLSRAHEASKLAPLVEHYLLKDLARAYPDIDYFDKSDLAGCLMDVYAAKKIPFVFIIDEWDCIFRECKQDVHAQKQYLDFIRSLVKDQPYVALAYMTGILPIKKYGTHSALNMFDEFSMANPGPLAAFAGFTDSEVKTLCSTYQMDYREVKRLYDGYCLEGAAHIYSPRSVVSAMLTRTYDNFWNKTETFEALRDYITLNFKGLRDTVTELLAGGRRKINTATFSNDMTTFSSADDVLTLLVHLGYLGYDFKAKEVFIPNSEVSAEFCNAVASAGWDTVADAVHKSDALLMATIRKDHGAVASALAHAHLETSILTYNNENSLACTIALAYYSAREYYYSFRELPAGKGVADIVYIPRENHPDKPALVIELKWDHSAESAIKQIKEKQYAKSLQGYHGALLLVGISYSPKTKEHRCIIEELSV